MSQETDNSQKQYSKEEIVEMEQKMLTYYREKIPQLKVQKEYETLLADIEEAKLRKIKAYYGIAYIHMESQRAEEEETETPPAPAKTPERKLKKK